MSVGDLVVMHIQMESGPDPGPAVTGWTQQYSADSGGGDYAYCWAKIVESGDIGGTFDLTGMAAGCDGAWIAYSISAGGGTLSLGDLNLSGPVGMATAEHDPPSITPSQGAGDYIVIVVFHENKGGFPTSWAADGPTGYDTLAEADEGGGTISPAIHSWSNLVAISTTEDPTEIGWSDSAGSRQYATATLAFPSVSGDPELVGFPVTASDIDSESATDGQVLTADGSGGAAWEDPSAGDHDHTQYILVAGTRAFTGDQSMGSNKLTNVTDPTAAQDAATKAYVDANAAGQYEVIVYDDGSGLEAVANEAGTDWLYYDVS